MSPISTLRALKKKITTMTSVTHVKMNPIFFIWHNFSVGRKKNTLSKTNVSCLISKLALKNPTKFLICCLFFPHRCNQRRRSCWWCIFIYARSEAHCHPLPHHRPAAVHRHSMILLDTNRRVERSSHIFI